MVEAQFEQVALYHQQFTQIELMGSLTISWIELMGSLTISLIYKLI
jgi:hypothetical protein